MSGVGLVAELYAALVAVFCGLQVKSCLTVFQCEAVTYFTTLIHFNLDVYTSFDLHTAQVCYQKILRPPCPLRIQHLVSRHRLDVHDWVDLNLVSSHFHAVIKSQVLVVALELLTHTYISSLGLKAPLSADARQLSGPCLRLTYRWLTPRYRCHQICRELNWLILDSGSDVKLVTQTTRRLVASCRFSVELFSSLGITCLCWCHRGVSGVWWAHQCRGGGQDTLWYFIKACGAVADNIGTALLCCQQCDHQMVCTDWMPRSPLRLIHTGGMLQGCCHTVVSSYWVESKCKLSCWDVQEAGKEQYISVVICS